jgi:hypothetical protein
MNATPKNVGFRRFLIENAVPYGEALPQFFSGFMSAYLDVLTMLKEKPKPLLTDSQCILAINKRFYLYVAGLSNHADPHFAQGPRNTTFRVLKKDGPPKGPSRYSSILSRMLERAENVTRQMRRNQPHSQSGASAPPPSLMYSPLYFCRLLLTAPTFTASSALAHAAIRAYLFEETLRFEGLWNATNRDATQGGSEERDAHRHENAFLRIRDIIRFDRVEASLNKIASFDRKRDNLPLKDATDFLVSHMLASKGLLMMRFSGEDGFIDPKNDDRNPGISRETFLRKGTLVSEIGVYQFDKPKEVRRLPTAAELINELDGLPIAIPGADHVFQGGLRFTTQSGVLGRVYGPAGIGKTSFALAIAAALAPLGTQTVYLSCEERTDDLFHRIRTLVPPFIKRTQSYSDPKEWFYPHHVIGKHSEKLNEVFSFLEETLSRFGSKLPKPENCPPGLMPLFIVLDGIHEMFPADSSESSGENLRKLIEKCQQTGAFVLAMSAEEVRADLAEFDYLVDLVATLEFAEIKSEMDPPSRLFRLKKTRRQLSRTGAHVLELAGPHTGVVIYPHIHKFLDESRGRFWVEPSKQLTVDFLLKREGFVPQEGEEIDRPLVEISDRSQVLLLGKGSSSKSLFGLRILASPFVHDDKLREFLQRRETKSGSRNLRLDFDNEPSNATSEEEWPWFQDVDPSERRILILSFLYQDAFYDDLKKKQKNWSRDSLSNLGLINLQTEVRHFAPGFLRPEELIGQIVDRLDAAELEGVPFHGVLLDGVHNVFLQFPHLEGSEILWPALFELLRTRGVSLVTTHTYFDVSEDGADMQDLQTSRRRVAPLLHALVQSSDYVIKVHPIAALKRDNSNFAVSVREHFQFDQNQAVLQNYAHRPPRPARYLIEISGTLSPTYVEPPVDWGWDRDRGTAFQVRKGTNPSSSGQRDRSAQSDFQPRSERTTIRNTDPRKR